MQTFRLRWWRMYLFGLALSLCWPSNGMALEPDEVLVISNRQSVQGMRLARYYMEKREIPKENLLRISVEDKETCSRETYDARVAEPVRRFLNQKDPLNKIRCLVTIYGMPLKVAPPKLDAKEQAAVKQLRDQRRALNKELEEIGEQEAGRIEKINKAISRIKQRIDDLIKYSQRSSLDSELALVEAGAYALSGWIPNPYFIGFRNKNLTISRNKVKWVSRLDGPTIDVVRRIIDDSIRIEKNGLEGTAYFDARWVEPEGNNLNGYALYDKSIHRAASRVKASGRMEAVVNETQALFKAGEAPGAALYCGWYSLGKYVDAFKWRPGAVGYHIASSECLTLKKAGSQVWCKRMLEEGVAATVGPTSEPYVQAFPVPEMFFGVLVDGRLTLAECYAASVPHWSWQMVLIGDPLYRPFGDR